MHELKLFGSVMRIGQQNVARGTSKCDDPVTTRGEKKNGKGEEMNNNDDVGPMGWKKMKNCCVDAKKQAISQVVGSWGL